MYVLWNAPVEALGQIFAFGQVESAGEVMAARDIDEGAGNSDGDDGDGDGTTSGSNVHSKQVKAVLLTAETQHTHQSRRNRNSHLPVLSRSPISPTERPFGPVRCRR